MTVPASALAAPPGNERPISGTKPTSSGATVAVQTTTTVAAGGRVGHLRRDEAVGRRGRRGLRANRLQEQVGGDGKERRQRGQPVGQDRANGLGRGPSRLSDRCNLSGSACGRPAVIGRRARRSPRAQIFGVTASAEGQRPGQPPDAAYAPPAAAAPPASSASPRTTKAAKSSRPGSTAPGSPTLIWIGRRPQPLPSRTASSRSPSASA